MMNCPLAAYPYCPNLVSIYICAFMAGFGSGNVDTAGNVIILKIWEGRDSGPYMHAIHFTFGLGSLLAPLIARPFLVTQEQLALELNMTETRTVVTDDQSSWWSIKTLYPLVASYGVLTSLWCLYSSLQDRKSDTNPPLTAKKANTENKTEDQPAPTTTLKLVVVGLLSIFFFLYVGMEVTFGTFISVFAVQSGLGFSRAQGSDLAAIFWGTFAAMRGLAVLLAIIARPVIVMWSSFILCLLGSTILSVWAGQSSLVLYLGTAVLGVGMASIFATGFLWAEQKISVTGLVSAWLIISSSLGAKLFPVIVGNLVERWPMMLHYLCVAIVCGCVLIFSLATFLTARY